MMSAAFFNLVLAMFSSTAAVQALQRRDDLDSINYEKWPASTLHSSLPLPLPLPLPSLISFIFFRNFRWWQGLVKRVV